MGRRDRERRERIYLGQEISIRTRRDILIKEVIRLATKDLFFDRSWDDSLDVNKQIADTITKALAEALTNVGWHTFSIADLTRREDWLEMYTRILHGVLAHAESFRLLKNDAQGGVWRLRKSRATRRSTRTWTLCADCGKPRLRTATRPLRARCKACWVAAMKRGVRRLDQATLERVYEAP